MNNTAPRRRASCPESCRNGNLVFDLNPKQFFVTGSVTTDDVPCDGGVRRSFYVLALLLGGAASAGPLRVVVISDLNGSYGSTTYAPRVDEAVRAIMALKPDLVISTGDMVAGQRRPHLSESEVRAMWDVFHRDGDRPAGGRGHPACRDARQPRRLGL